MHHTTHLPEVFSQKFLEAQLAFTIAFLVNLAVFNQFCMEGNLIPTLNANKNLSYMAALTASGYHCLDSWHITTGCQQHKTNLNDPSNKISNFKKLKS